MNGIEETYTARTGWGVAWIGFFASGRVAFGEAWKHTGRLLDFLLIAVKKQADIVLAC